MGILRIDFCVHFWHEKVTFLYDLCSTKIVSLRSVEIRFTRSATKHRVSRASSAYVVENAEEWFEIGPEERSLAERDARRLYLGADETGRVLEVIAIKMDNGPILVIHAMPIRNRFKPWIEEGRE